MISVNFAGNFSKFSYGTLFLSFLFSGLAILGADKFEEPK